MELTQLYQFKKVAETGSVSGAAEQLFVSQSALSQSIQKLEKELGFKCFDRTKNKLLLNFSGQQVLNYVERILDEADNLKKFAAEHTDSRQRFNMATSIPACLRFFVPYFNKTGDVDVSGILTNEKTLKDGLREKNFDFIITTEKIEEENIARFTLFEDNLMIGVPPSHPLTSCKSVSVKQLTEHKILIPPD